MNRFWVNMASSNNDGRFNNPQFAKIQDIKSVQMIAISDL